MFVKDTFPDAKLICHFEWYFHAYGTDADFLPDYPLTEDMHFRIRTRNASILMDLESCDAGVAPTLWQRDKFPQEFHHELNILHEGIDRDYFKPAKNARLVLPGLDLSGVD